MALGRIFAASFASPAATPTISVPPKAKTTPSVSAKTGARPSGNQPPDSEMLWTPAVYSPTGDCVGIAQMATPMKMRIVATLIIANQNSASPKALTLIMLRTKTSASATRAITH